MSFTTLDHVIARALATPGWYEERVLPRLTRDASGCLVWKAGRRGGYGQISAPMNGGKQIKLGVHRVVWIKERGQIPLGLVLDHDGPTGCHNRACAEPGHLQAVTSRHNTVATGTGLAAQNALKETCPAGHALSGDNLVPSQVARGSRLCLQCDRDRDRERSWWISQACDLLGMSHRAYRAQYGWSRRVAQETVATFESMAA